ncbi:hypothetical protein G4B88_013480 [Cannabis sativa]|uniref:RNase H type-1 domain-containing protein n=1 Tax=Cannabis sativa TaxID=3483 RepID=A0A7J6HKD8_CANSA|nr:hypothetical protein G4B88_013480 [Cannabis sativa]
MFLLWALPEAWVSVGNWALTVASNWLIKIKSLEAFWKELGDFTCSCPLPLVIIGDLNGTLKDGECLNYVGSSSTSRYSFDLRRMVHRTGLIDLGFLGVKFTWFKRGSYASAGSNLKRARLDRALASADWRIAWPNAILNHLTASSSDHNPILLDTEGGRFCTKAMFKYELMWERDPRVFWVVKKAWNLIQHKDPMVNLYRKLKTTKQHLSRWNKSHFKWLSTQIAEAKNKLERPLNLCFTEFLLGALCTFDIIWKVRNKLLHNSVKLGMAEAIQQVCRLFQDHKSTSHATLRKERIITTPPEDWIACFTDITTAPDHAFGAAVFRDCNNRLRTAFSSRLHVTDPTLAEATMLVIAANYAAKNNLHNVLFFCDNSPVVQYFNSSIPDNYHQKLAGAADRFRSNVHPLESFKLCHIPRSQNFCAHNMAKWAKLHNVTGDIDLGAIEVGVFSNEEEWNPGAKGIG